MICNCFILKLHLNGLKYYQNNLCSIDQSSNGFNGHLDLISCRIMSLNYKKGPFNNWFGCVLVNWTRKTWTLHFKITTEIIEV